MNWKKKNNRKTVYDRSKDKLMLSMINKKIVKFISNQQGNERAEE